MSFWPLSVVESKPPPPPFPLCERCRLFKRCKTPRMPPSGKNGRRIMIVGEFPGAGEDEEGRAFVGPSGQLLSRLTRKWGVNLREDCVLLNALSCRPKRGFVEDERAVEYCRPLVLNAIEKYDPVVILPLGKRAVRSVIGHLWKEDTGGVLRWAGWKIPCRKPNAWICHPSHVLVETDRGLVTIDEVRTGDKVLTHAGRWRDVYETMSRQYAGSLYVIKRRGSSKPLESTSSHPYYVFREGKYVWLRADEISAGDYMTEPLTTEPEKTIDEGTVWTYVKPRTCGQQAKGNLDIRATESTMKVLGYYLAEGNLCSKGSVTEFAFCEDEVQLHDDLSSAVKEVTGQRQDLPVVRQKNSRVYVLRKNSVVLSRFLVDNCGSGAAKKSFPRWVWSCSNRLLTILVKAVWDGDGHFTGRSYEIDLCSRQLIEDLRKALLRLGVVSHLYSKKRTSGYGPPSRWKAQYRLHVGGQAAERMSKWMGGNIEGTQFRKPNQSPFIMNGYVHYKVKEITVRKLETPITVYNMEVSDDHSFIADGVSSHNCPSINPAHVLREQKERGTYKDDGMAERFLEGHLRAAISLAGSRPWKQVPDYSEGLELFHNDAQAERAVLDLIKTGAPTAFDYETNMAKPQSDKARIVCASMSNGDRHVAFFWRGKAKEAFLRFLASPVRKVAQNMAFEDSWSVEVAGVKPVNWWWDTMQMAHVLDNRRGISGLKFQAYVHLGQEDYDHHLQSYLHTEKGAEIVNRIHEIEPNQLLKYCCYDSKLELMLAKIQTKRLGVKWT